MHQKARGEGGLLLCISTAMLETRKTNSSATVHVAEILEASNTHIDVAHFLDRLVYNLNDITIRPRDDLMVRLVSFRYQLIQVIIDLAIGYSLFT